jgi:hypothetical protein
VVYTFAKPSLLSLLAIQAAVYTRHQLRSLSWSRSFGMYILISVATDNYELHLEGKVVYTFAKPSLL